MGEAAGQEGLLKKYLLIEVPVLGVVGAAAAAASSSATLHRTAARAPSCDAGGGGGRYVPRMAMARPGSAVASTMGAPRAVRAQNPVHDFNDTAPTIL
jgi:hypothetical protein